MKGEEFVWYFLKLCLIHHDRYALDSDLLKDWWADKKPHGWFVGSINKNFSLMPVENFMLTPNDTNLDESAHPHANAFTGTNLPLLDAIDGAYELDCTQVAKISRANKTHVLPNHRNTFRHWLRANAKRHDAQVEAAAQRRGAVETIDNIDAQIADLDAERNAMQVEAKELKERKKALRGETGVKRK
ncbi:hypothetical protein PHLCEN_2v2610 [Hermanssonia centrifuga]|uniref:Uncharacterized protein n=1 Tax=Hermanssonia centrifuga TaxID=98765 RepID=A0A2R6RIR8_9APHY|nr:hypothetical protein PHLCEN_2v2610 [Hermanssonia centrifuga]